MDIFKDYGKDTCIYEECGEITLSYVECFKKYHGNETLIEYKAKGENMTQEEMKHKLQEVAKLHEVAFDISVAIGTFARGTLTSESALQEAKSSAKKLIEKIDDYLETSKPKFKVGDYVVELDKYITKIEKNDNDMLKGHFYIPRDNYFSFTEDTVSSYTARHATSEEIAEYEVALQFHKHGRKPFEVKEGDLIEYKSGEKRIVSYPENYSKDSFIEGNRKLLKTVEEVNEWIKGE